MDSNFQTGTQQAGLKAGDGGFLVNVGQNTTLIGGVISSSEQAVADGLNQLSTGTLIVKDLQRWLKKAVRWPKGGDRGMVHSSSLKGLIL
jgi:hypothetical protein